MKPVRIESPCADESSSAVASSTRNAIAIGRNLVRCNVLAENCIRDAKQKKPATGHSVSVDYKRSGMIIVLAMMMMMAMLLWMCTCWWITRESTKTTTCIVYDYV